MQVKMIPVVSYKVETLDGKALGVFNKRDGWQGFVRLESDNGGTARNTLIVDAPDEFAFPMFGLPQRERERVVTVIKSSGPAYDLLNALAATPESGKAQESS